MQIIPSTQLNTLALLLIGYSLFGALALALTHFRISHYQGQRQSQVMGVLLLLALCALQVAHFQWLYLGLPMVGAMPYRITLFAIAPAFFLFSQPLLQGRVAPQWDARQLVHGLPLVMAAFLPDALALPLAFLIGLGYLLWLGHSLYLLRAQRDLFRQEMTALGAVFAIALVVGILGLVRPALPDKLFFSLYAIAIGLAFLLVHIALGLRPSLSEQVQETAQTAQVSYAATTLAHVDCEAALATLAALMSSERLYTDADLKLSSLADRMGLSAHQLSELLNTRLGKGFSRYLREQRVAAAKIMLRDEPSASVLSVGLNVGFTSQSNFYEAFRELEGSTPGQYRRLGK
jgi:AraC-like DNA-binding protein